MKYFKWIFRHTLSIAWGSLIFYLTVLSTPKVNPDSWLRLIPFVDKWVHLSLFFVFNFILFLEQKKTNENNSFYYLASIILGIVYGGLIELFQAFFTTNRSAEYLDWLADIVGVLLAYLIFKYLFKSVKQTKNV